eukprot:5084768-Lingulodinium_polyedra.AAC.1
MGKLPVGIGSATGEKRCARACRNATLHSSSICPSHVRPMCVHSSVLRASDGVSSHLPVAMFARSRRSSGRASTQVSRTGVSA